MELKSMDKLIQSKELINGLRSTMIFLETGKKEKAVPVALFSTFETVLEKIGLLLYEIEEIEKKEK